MASAVQSEPAEVSVLPQAEHVPWVVWTAALAIVSAPLGGLWDISWHISVGRDTFWTPAHLLIQLCAAIGGLTAVYFILRTMLGNDKELRARSVRVFGLRAPLGAFLCGWGGLTMLTSAPFDNWWHAAYGIDVKIISPPHTVLALGIGAVMLGGFLLIMAQLNHSTVKVAQRLDYILIILVGVVMLGAQSELLEGTNRLLMHSAIFYRCLAVPFPALLMLIRTISPRKWACTASAAVYTVLSLGQEWLFPLFPAAPKLGPVYQQVSHMVPLGFPFLIIVPAVLIDLLWPKLQGWNPWKQTLILGTLFFLTIVAVQWPFANFLVSTLSANWFFGTHYQMYMIPLDTLFARGEWFPYEKSAAEFWLGMGIALVSSLITVRLGLMAGRWLRGVQR